MKKYVGNGFPGQKCGVCRRVVKRGQIAWDHRETGNTRRPVYFHHSCLEDLVGITPEIVAAQTSVYDDVRDQLTGGAISLVLE